MQFDYASAGRPLETSTSVFVLKFNMHETLRPDFQSKIIAVCLGNCAPETDVPGFRVDVFYVLMFVSDADQFRFPPFFSCGQKLEASVVETASHAESHTAVIKRDERRQNEVQGSGVDIGFAWRFENSEAVRRQCHAGSKSSESQAVST